MGLLNAENHVPPKSFTPPSIPAVFIYNKEVKILPLVLLVFSFSAHANSFVYEDRPYDFRLKISRSEISFSSESFKYSLIINDCNLPLARALNSEIISKSHSEKNGKLRLLVDEKVVRVGSKSPLRNYLRNMHVRIMQFGVEEKKKCG